MHYWRENTFRGLARIADSLDGEPDFFAYVEYLRLRERGLRAASLARLDAFILQASAWEFTKRCDIVHKLMCLQHDAPEVVKLIPTPLHRKLIALTLDEWVEHEPTNPIPFRWRGREDDWRHAARLDPQEIIARLKLIDRLVNAVAYATHELPRGYIGSPAEDLESLNEVDHLLAELPPERRGGRGKVSR